MNPLTPPQPSKEWTLASVNRDEDLHYSSYFLSSSVRQGASPHGALEAVVSVYLGTDECYFVRAEECARVADSIMDAAIRGDRAIDDELALLSRSIESLSSLAAEWRGRMHAEAVLGDALEFYSAHDHVLSRMYDKARQFETLDRGRQWLTSRIIGHIQSEYSGDEPWAVMQELVSSSGGTRFPIPSLVSAEARALIAHIASEITDEPTRDVLLARPGLIYQYAPAADIRALRREVAKTQFLTYHGYVGRRQREFDDFLPLMMREMARQWWAAPPTRAIIDSHTVLSPTPSPILKSLTRLYAQVTRSKLRRRLVQLHVFPLLDDALAIIAEHLGTTERSLRFMLPGEVRALLAAGSSGITEDVTRRQSGALAFWGSGSARVLADPQLADRWWAFGATQETPDGPSDLRGQGAYPGVVSGPAVVSNRLPRHGVLEPGYILVSEATDLDLLPVIEGAVGVITERGGVTSHAATICRELRIPSVVGVKGATTVIRGGDFVQIDGGRGTVARLGG